MASPSVSVWRDVSLLLSLHLMTTRSTFCHDKPFYQYKPCGCAPVTLNHGHFLFLLPTSFLLVFITTACHPSFLHTCCSHKTCHLHFMWPSNMTPTKLLKKVSPIVSCFLVDMVNLSQLYQQYTTVLSRSSSQPFCLVYSIFCHTLSTPHSYV